MNQPLQPITRDKSGVIRFKENAIVRYLLDYARKHGCGMNELAIMTFSDEDRVQFAQLIGYSLSGFSELDYVSDADYERAEKAAESIRASREE